MILLDKIKAAIRNVEDFPVKGVQFKDLTTILKNPIYLRALKDNVVSLYKDAGVTKVIGLEARGFILAPAIAIDLNAGFIPERKKGKLPFNVVRHEYEKEYGKDIIEIHEDALSKNDIVLIHDDVLATGGTLNAAVDLVRKFNVKKIYVNVIVELDYLRGRDAITKDVELTSLIHFN